MEQMEARREWRREEIGGKRGMKAREGVTTEVLYMSRACTDFYLQVSVVCSIQYAIPYCLNKESESLTPCS